MLEWMEKKLTLKVKIQTVVKNKKRSQPVFIHDKTNLKLCPFKSTAFCFSHPLQNK